MAGSIWQTHISEPTPQKNMRRNDPKRRAKVQAPSSKLQAKVFHNLNKALPSSPQE